MHYWLHICYNPIKHQRTHPYRTNEAKTLNILSYFIFWFHLECSRNRPQEVRFKSKIFSIQLIYLIKEWHLWNIDTICYRCGTIILLIDAQLILDHMSNLGHGCGRNTLIYIYIFIYWIKELSFHLINFLVRLEIIKKFILLFNQRFHCLVSILIYLNNYYLISVPLHN